MAMLSYNNRPNNVNGQPTPPSSTSSADHLPIKTSPPDTMQEALNGTRQPDKHHHIWLITGPAGCGKSTVAQFVARALNLPFIEGDEVRWPSQKTNVNFTNVQYL